MAKRNKRSSFRLGHHRRHRMKFGGGVRERRQKRNEPKLGRNKKKYKVVEEGKRKKGKQDLRPQGKAIVWARPKGEGQKGKGANEWMKGEGREREEEKRREEEEEEWKRGRSKDRVRST